MNVNANDKTKTIKAMCRRNNINKEVEFMIHHILK